MGGTYANVPIIAMSANVTSDEVVRFKTAGMNGNIGKPFVARELAQVLRFWSDFGGMAAHADAGDVETIGGTRAGVSSGATPSLSGRVLLVDDLDLVQMIIDEMLGEFGYQVMAVANGAKAVEAFRSDPNFDVILMDMPMPVMSALQAIKAIREMERSGDRPRVPIIALTADASGDSLHHWMAAGADAHVRKPVQLDALRAVIDRLGKSNQASDHRDGLDSIKPSMILDNAMIQDLRKWWGRTDWYLLSRPSREKQKLGSVPCSLRSRQRRTSLKEHRR